MILVVYCCEVGFVGYGIDEGGVIVCVVDIVEVFVVLLGGVGKVCCVCLIVV